jgi:hypothetical protein
MTFTAHVVAYSARFPSCPDISPPMRLTSVGRYGRFVEADPLRMG